MAGRILIVHNDDYFASRVGAALRAAGHTVTISSAVVDALEKLDAMPPPDVLITRMRFEPGSPNGVSLANMAHHKHPRIKIVFTALREVQHEAAGLGTFLAEPVSIPALVAAVNDVLVGP